MRPLALVPLLALLVATLLTLAPVAADGEPNEFELILSLAEDSDNVVPPGGELTVNAVLRFPWQPPITPPPSLPGFTAYELAVPEASEAASTLRVSGALDWDSAGRQRLDIPAHTLLLSRLPTVAGADRPMAKALDGRTLIARDRAAKLHVFDSYTLAHQATINPPTDADTGFHNGFGASVAYNNTIGGFDGSAIALWHETDARAWLFVGSYHDTVESTDQLGRFYIFRLDWGDDGVTVTQEGALAPTLAEANNRHGTVSARYGAAVVISRDGGTLAVSAPTMNEMGAIYVYSRPAGAGEDWGDITYDDGVKVTVAAVPSFGTSTSTMPFLPGTAYDASNPRSCDAWCSRVWSNIDSKDNYDGVDLAAAFVSLSADGRVLATGAPEKDFAGTTPGGGFTGANQRDNAGEAFVWVAPEGGWRNAPRADLDAQGNAKTLIAAQTDATSFRQATHYSPGPLRRWTEPAAILTPDAWPNRGPGYFGLATTVSPDGAVVAVTDSRSAHSMYLFQQNSADGWAALNGGYLTASAALTDLGAPIFGTQVFNYDGSALAVGDPDHSGNRGSVLIFSRPADGTWVSAGLAGAARRLERASARSANASYGYVVPELQGPRAVIASKAGRNYLTAPSVRGCAVSTVDGVATASCPLSLPDTRITVPAGTPDGPFTISTRVALRLEETSEPIVTLRDTLEVTIGEVDELTEVQFDFANDTMGDSDPSNDRPYPGTIAAGESTTLLLKLLNENGAASARGAIASVLFNASHGKLSAALGDADDEACAPSGLLVCQIATPATTLTANNADKIRLTVEHPGPGKSGAASVRVNVLASDGESFAAGPIALIFSGPPSALAIAAPSRGLLSHGTCDAPAADGPDGCKVATDRDDRDLLTLQVTAADAAGNKVAVPTSGYGAPKITGPDGNRVPTRAIAVTWPLRKDGDDAGAAIGGNDPLDTRNGAPQAQINVNALQTAPLAAGRYTIELAAGGLKTTQTFHISGPPASVSLSEPQGEFAPGGQLTLTATIADADGNAVPDGTRVTWEDRPIGASTVLVQLSAQSETKDGQASASYLVSSLGAAYVSASAGSETDLRLITISQAGGGAAADSPAASLSNRRPGRYSTWQGAEPVSAAALLAALDGVTALLLWTGDRWLSYGLAPNGQRIANSINFRATPGATLWLAD